MTASRVIRAYWPGLILAGVLAGILRAFAARGELWLDEIWSLVTVRQTIKSPIEIITVLKLDNNHFINSLWIWLQPDSALDFDFRLLSIVAGSLGVMFAAAICGQHSRLSMSVGAIIIGTSFLQVHYSSEARGYGPLCAAVLWAVWSDRKSRQSPGIIWEVSWSISCLLGFLAHAAFVQYWLPAILLTCWSFFRPRPASASVQNYVLISAQFVFRIALPGALFLWIWRTNLSQMQIAGGSVAAYWKVIVDTMSLSVGVSPGLPEAAVGAGVMLLLSLFVVRFLLKTEPQDAFLLIFSAIVVPAILMAVMNRQDIYPRYFLIGTLLFQLSLARWIASLLETGGRPQRRYRQLAGCALLFAFVFSNATLDRQLIVLQRGHYQDAIRWLQENAKSESILLGVDHPFRHRFPLGYYVARTEIGERLRLTTSPEQVPDWLLVHDLNRTAQPPETVASASGVQFRLQTMFRAAPLSGWNLLIYRRDGSESAGSADDSKLR